MASSVADSLQGGFFTRAIPGGAARWILVIGAPAWAPFGVKE